MNIIEAILHHAQDVLQAALIDNVPADDTARAGVVMQGPLQGNPDPDQARISVTVHENDPDNFYGKTGTGAMGGEWNDEVAETECGGGVIWSRKFTVKARCLYVNTGEGLDAARVIASTVRQRIENALLSTSWGGVFDAESSEFVSRGVLGTSLRAEMIQAGGPPDAYDYHIKVRFEVQTSVVLRS